MSSHRVSQPVLLPARDSWTLIKNKRVNLLGNERQQSSRTWSCHDPELFFEAPSQRADGGKGEDKVAQLQRTDQERSPGHRRRLCHRGRYLVVQVSLVLPFIITMMFADGSCEVRLRQRDRPQHPSARRVGAGRAHLFVAPPRRCPCIDSSSRLNLVSVALPTNIIVIMKVSTQSGPFLRNFLPIRQTREGCPGLCFK